MLPELNILYPNPSDKKVVKLLANNNARGYLAYVRVLQYLQSNSNKAEANYKDIGYILHYPSKLIQSIIEDYDLFVVEDGYFQSVDLESHRDEVINSVHLYEELEHALEVSRKRAEAGKRGMKSRWNNKSDFVIENADNKTDFVINKSITEKEKQEKENVPPAPPLKEKEIKEKEQPYDGTPSLSSDDDAGQEPSINYQALVEYWNKTTKCIFGKLLSIDGYRRKMVNARIKQWGKHNFIEAINIAIQSDFLKGQSGRNFMMTFDWFIKPTNFQKVLEHNYDNKSTSNNINASGVTGTGNSTADNARRVYANLDQLASQVVLSPSDVQELQ